MSTDLEKDLKHLKDDFAKLRGDLGELTTTLTKLGKDRFDDARESVEDGGGALGKELRGGLKILQKRGRKTFGRLEHEIEERPIAALVGAFAVGFVISKLLDRS